MKDPNADLKKYIAKTIGEAIGQSEERMTNNFKKFVTDSVGGAVAELGRQLRNENKIMRQELKQEIGALRTEMHDGFAGVAEAFENLARIRDKDRDYVDAKFAEHEREITRLKKRIA